MQMSHFQAQSRFSADALNANCLPYPAQAIEQRGSQIFPLVLQLFLSRTITIPY